MVWWGGEDFLDHLCSLALHTVVTIARVRVSLDSQARGSRAGKGALVDGGAVEEGARTGLLEQSAGHEKYSM